MRITTKGDDKRRQDFLAAITVLCFLSLATAVDWGEEQNFAGPTRRTLKQVEEVRVSTEEALRSALEKNATTVVVEAGMKLERSVEIVADGMVLKGETTIECGGANFSALIVRASDVTVEGLTFSHCTGAPAVLVTPSDPSLLPITFIDTTFQDNGDVRPTVNGSGLSIRSCTNEQCNKTSVRLLRCRFYRNRASSGGGLFVEDADTTMQDCSFFYNSAVSSGGGICSILGRISIQNSTFEGNDASEVGGGGSFLRTISLRIDRSQFVNNTACIRGGGIDLVYDGNFEDPIAELNISRTDFEGNTVQCLSKEETPGYQTDIHRNVGGGMAMIGNSRKRVKGSLWNVTFIANRARYGGGCLIFNFIEAPVELVDAVFRQNRAQTAGGGIFLHSATMMAKSTMLIKNEAHLGGAVFVSVKGQFITEPSGDDTSRLSVMEENRAIYGGAIVNFIAEVMRLRSLIIRNNTAYRYGGGMMCFTSAMQVELSGVRIEGNRAVVGGGIALRATPLRLAADEGRPVEIVGNIASVGGGIYFDTGRYLLEAVEIHGTILSNNHAVNMDHPSMQALLTDSRRNLFQDLSPVRPFGFLHHLTDVSIDSVADILASVPQGHGGGLCMTLANIDPFNSIQVTIKDVIMNFNQAVVGGGASIHFSGLFWNRGNDTRCAAGLTESTITCQRFYLSNVTIRENEAYYVDRSNQ